MVGTGIDRAISRAGGQVRLAEALSQREPITPQAIQQWQRKGFVPPPRRPDERNRILDVEETTGVHRHYLNATVYPEPPGEAA
jgi:hypothetical protein